MALLEAKNLSIRYPGGKPLHLPDLRVEAGQIVPLLGASGSGKSSFALHALGLLPAGCATSGQLTVNGRLGWIPQDVSDAFSPFQRIALQLCDGAQHHLGLALSEALRVAATLLEQVGIPPERMQDHPHRWSGGMLQRGLLVMALLAQPKVVIADEPTSALDDHAADKVCDVLLEYAARGNAIVLISHDARVRERLTVR